MVHDKSIFYLLELRELAASQQDLVCKGTCKKQNLQGLVCKGTAELSIVFTGSVRRFNAPYI